MRRCCWWLGVVCGIALSGASRADFPEADKKLVDEVWARLLAVVDPPGSYQWPPKCEIEDDQSLNAYANATKEGKDNLVPHVVVYAGLLKNVIHIEHKRTGDADRLAYVLGHELGHIVLRHVVRTDGSTPFLKNTFTREHEIEADRKGMELALKAGYSFTHARRAIDQMISLKMEYSSFEGLGVNHPSWKERLQLLDKKQSVLWRAMSAFENGNFFLLCEQYAAAEGCFEKVTREFPDCHEAFSNLGYARLMKYCDALEVGDLLKYDVGQIVVGGFYQRPKTLESKVRGVDDETWKLAVDALDRALSIKPDLVLAKANLGIAYLVHPDGKPDIKRAKDYLQTAADGVGIDHTLEPSLRAAVLVNAGVASLVSGESDESRKRFDEADKTLARRAGGPPLRAAKSALLYNRALLLASSEDKAMRREAVRLFESYLKTGDSASAWSSVAYERYAVLCKQLGQEAKAKLALASPSKAKMRLLTGLELGHGGLITLGEPRTEVENRLGKVEAEPLYPGLKMVRLRFTKHKIEVLADELVLAVFLRSLQAPAVPVRPVGPGTAVSKLQVGITQEKLEDVLAEQNYDYRQLDNPEISYRFYFDLGLAVRIEKNKVSELVLAQIPRAE